MAILNSRSSILGLLRWADGLFTEVYPVLPPGGDCLDMLANNLLRAEPDECLQTEKNHHEIIDLTKRNQNVGQEVERSQNVGND